MIKMQIVGNETIYFEMEKPEQYITITFLTRDMVLFLRDLEPNVNSHRIPFDMEWNSEKYFKDRTAVDIIRKFYNNYEEIIDIDFLRPIVGECLYAKIK